jgi:hypothetical protein
LIIIAGLYLLVGLYFAIWYTRNAIVLMNRGVIADDPATFLAVALAVPFYIFAWPLVNHIPSILEWLDETFDHPILTLAVFWVLVGLLAAWLF